MTVYLIRHPGDDAVKIGYTAGDPQDRLRSMQTGSASPLELLAVIPDAPRAVETELHRRFADLRLAGEWFMDRPVIQEAFHDHRAAHHRQHLLDRIRLAREALAVVTDDPDISTQLLERVIRLGHEALDETACGCTVPEQRRKESSTTNDSVSAFWKEFRLHLAWDLVPFTFAYDLYGAWLADVSTSASPVSKQRFIADLVAIVQKDSLWCCENKGKQLRRGHLMDSPEPLIAEYDLEKWRSSSYQGSDPLQIGQPSLLSRYRGILRRVSTTTTDEEDD